VLLYHTRDNPMWGVSLSEITHGDVARSDTPHLMSGCRDMIFPLGLVSSGCNLRSFALRYSVPPQAIHHRNYLSKHVRLLN
jgi:hypothetical protein